MAAKVVVVTGCDSGFGRIAASRLSSQGWHVVAGCFTDDGIADLKKESTSITPSKLDVTKDESVAAFAKVVEGKCSDGLHGLINNAGIAPTGFIEWAPLSDLQRAMEINVYGQIRMVKALAPLLRKAKGRIVNVSSMCGRLAIGGAPWYSCTKYAVEGWTDSLRREMRPFGISVHLVEPGFFKTQMVQMEQYAKELNTQWDVLGKEQQEAYGKSVLMGHIQNIQDQIDLMLDPNAGKVVDAMIQALTDRFAKVRYPVGGSCKFLFLPVSHMPTWIADGILGAMNPKYTPAKAAKQLMPRRLDLVALWLFACPALAYGMCKKGDYSKTSATLISFLIAWCLSWKWS